MGFSCQLSEGEDGAHFNATEASDGNLFCDLDGCFPALRFDENESAEVFGGCDKGAVGYGWTAARKADAGCGGARLKGFGGDEVTIGHELLVVGLAGAVEFALFRFGQRLQFLFIKKNHAEIFHGLLSLCPGVGPGMQQDRQLIGTGSPAMEPLVVVADADAGIKELAEAGLGEELGTRAVADDAAAAHEDDAVDFRQDVAEVMGDEDEAGAFGGEAAHGVAELALRGKVQCVGRLIEEKLAGAMDESAGDEDAAFFSGGHFADELFGEMRRINAGEGFNGARAHLITHVQIGPERRSGEKAGDDGVKAGGDGGALAGEIGADDTEVPAKLGKVPAVAAEDADAHAGLNDGIDLAGDGEDERGFAAAVGAKDGDMFAGADGEIDVVQDDALAAGNVDIAQFQELIEIDVFRRRTL